MPPLPQQPLPQPQQAPPALPPTDAFEQSYQKHKAELEPQPTPTKTPVSQTGGGVPGQDPKVGADPLRGILDPIQVDNAVKHQAWDAFHAAKTPEEFRQFFDSAPLPNQVKHALWNLKFAPPIGDLQGTQQAIAQSQGASQAIPQVPSAQQWQQLSG